MLDAVARARLSAQGLVGGAPDPVAAVRRLLAVQAQDVVAPLQAIAARTAAVPTDAVPMGGAPSRAAVEAAFADGSLVRTWSMRGTLHVVAAEDVGWLLAVTGERTLAVTRTIRARDGVTDADLRIAAEVVAGLPDEGLRRPDLLAAFAAAGVDPGGTRGYHVILALAAQGHLHLGARDGSQYRLHRSDGRLPQAPALETDTALARLAVRFFAGHGPATVADLAKWAALPVTAARRGVAGASDALQPGLPLDGEATWAAADAPPPAAPGTVLALPAFDELVIGYATRGPALRDLPITALAPTSNGRFLPFAAIDGRVVATLTPHVTPLVPLAADQLQAVEAAAARWAGWSAA